MKKLLIIAMLLASPLWAVEPGEMLPDAAQEARAREISKGLRCLVCRNENIDDSNAGLARDLRLLVRERITEGDSNEAVVAFVVARYGEYVLLNPKTTGTNMLLWAAGPLMLLGGGVLAVLGFSRRRRAVAAPADLTDEESVRLAKILDP